MQENIIIPPATAGTNGFFATTGGNHGHGHGHYPGFDWHASTAERLKDDHSRHAAVTDAAIGQLRGDVFHSTEEAQENAALLQKQVGDAATATVVGFKDAQAIAYQIEGRSGLEAAKNFYQLNLQGATNFNALTVQATANAAAAELRAQTIAASAAAQLAECCCEMKLLQKDTIAASLANTQMILDKMDKNTIDDLRAQLIIAKSGSGSGPGGGKP